jgi:hypothetical protein
MKTLFRHFIGVDYSGAQTPTASRPSAMARPNSTAIHRQQFDSRRRALTCADVLAGGCRLTAFRSLIRTESSWSADSVPVTV